MKRYQLRADGRGFSGIIEDIVYAVTHADPHVSRVVVAETAKLMLSGRAHQTERCGAHAECDAVGAPVFPVEHPVETRSICGIYDPDAHDLPNVFAAAVVTGGPPRERPVADAFRRAIAPFLYECSSCGASALCLGVPTDPTHPTRR